MENFEEFKEEDYKQFFEWLLEKEVELEKEMDFTLCSTSNEPYVFYPKDILPFIQTKPMQRLKKIVQLGTSVLNNVDAAHTRYAHCLGTYNNAVIFYMFQYNNPEWKTRIETEGRKIEVLADIMEALRHDDGHNILSHGLERLIGYQKGVHEIIGARFKEENQETIAAIERIHPDLLKAMKKVSNPDYDLITLREGNLDFDRLDFITRDALYLGLKEKRELVYKLLKGSSIHTFESNGKQKEMLVYEYETLPYIEAFIEARATLYKEIVSSNERKSLDVLEEEFCRIFVDSDENVGQRLKEYLIHCRGNTPKTIDLQKFLEWDDLKYYNELIDIAMTAKDPNIVAIATACIPTREALCTLAIETLNPKETPPEAYTEEDLKFIKNVQNILQTSHPLHDKLVEGVARTCLVTLEAISEEDLENVLESLRKKGFSEEELSAIITWNARINKYNFAETIYVKDKEGNIVPLQDHPELSIDLSSTNIAGALLVPAKLRRLQISSDKIELIKKEFEEHNSKYPREKANSKRVMRTFQIGNEPYIPEYQAGTDKVSRQRDGENR